jgi:hypothetical protein
VLAPVCGRAAFGDVFIGKMLPNPFPLIVAQSQHAPRIIEISFIDTTILT